MKKIFFILLLILSSSCSNERKEELEIIGETEIRSYHLYYTKDHSIKKVEYGPLDKRLILEGYYLKKGSEYIPITQIPGER